MNISNTFELTVISFQDLANYLKEKQHQLWFDPMVEAIDLHYELCHENTGFLAIQRHRSAVQ